MKAKIYLILRIVFSLAAAALLAAAIFVFVYAGWEWGLVCVFATLLCAGLMIFFRNKHRALDPEERQAPRGDFITGKVPDDDGDSADV